MREHFKKIGVSQKETERFLRRAGIHTRAGKLTKRYRS